MQMKISFTVDKWDESPVDEENENYPVKIAHVLYELNGDLSGTAKVEYLLNYSEENVEDVHMSKADVLGYMFFKGLYKGKEASFTASEIGAFAKGDLNCSGTFLRTDGALSGFTGSYSYIFEGKDSFIILDTK